MEIKTTDAMRKDNILVATVTDTLSPWPFSHQKCLNIMDCFKVENNEI